MEFFSRLLGGLALFSARNPKKILILSLLLALGGVYLASSLSLETKISALLPKEAPQLQEQQALMKKIGQEDFLIVLVEAPPGFPIRYYRRFIRNFKKELSALPLAQAKGMATTRGTPKNLGKYLKQHGLYLLRLQELEELNQLLAPERIRELLSKDATEGYPAFSPKFDPLKLRPFIEKVFIPFEDVTLEKRGTYFHFKSQEAGFFFLGIQGTAGHFKKTKAFLKEAHRLEKEVWKRVAQRKVRQPGSKVAKLIPPPKVTLLGLPVILQENHDILSRTLRWNLLLALAGIALLFYIFFGRIRTLFLAYFPLLLGLIGSFALARLTVGSLNILTVGIGGILIGLGIDFPAYLLNRYYQFREQGKDLSESLELTWSTTGRSVFFGALTTSAAFLLMMASNFKAFQELGIIAGFGILFTLLAVLVLLPALITLVGQVDRGKEIQRYPRPLLRLPLHHPKATLGICLALFLGFGLFLTQFRWQPLQQEARRSLEASSSPSIQAFQRFSQMLNASLIPIPLLLQGQDLQKSLNQSDQLVEVLKKFQGEGILNAYESLSRLLPSKLRQKELQENLPSFTNLDPENFYRVYTESLPGAKFKGASGHKAYRDFLTDVLRDPQITTWETLQTAGLEGLVDRYFQEEKGKILLKSYVYLPPEADYFAARKRFFEALEKEPLAQKGLVYQPPEEKIFQQIRKEMSQELEWLGVGVFLVVFLLVLIYFRSLGLTLLSLIPMVLGLLAALGTYTLLVGPFSALNFLWFPIYLGLAVDDVIHLGAHFRQPGESLNHALQYTGGAIVFTSLATMIGFGSLGLVSFPIVQQAGLFICLAMFWELVASLAFLPALWNLIYKKAV